MNNTLNTAKAAAEFALTRRIFDGNPSAIADTQRNICEAVAAGATPEDAAAAHGVDARTVWSLLDALHAARVLPSNAR